MTVITQHTDNNRVFAEFSPKKLILQAQSTGRFVLSKWLKILLFGMICGAAIVAYTWFKKPLYLAEITFAIDEEATQSTACGFASLREELGLGSPYETGTVFSSVTNIVELMQSRLLIEKTLRRTVTIDGKALTFADFLLDSLDYRDKWVKNSPYQKTNFRIIPKDSKELLFQSSLIQNMYETLIKQNIKIDRKGKGTSIISVTCLSKHELFSKYFLEAWLNEVTQYYIETKTRRYRMNLAVVQKRTDSVRTAYNNALYGRASYADAHFNPARQTISVSGEKQQTDVLILKNVYVELVNTLESAKTTLMKETPLILYLDTPILPLKVVKPNMIKRFVLCFLLGVFLAAGYFLVVRIYRSILQ